MLFSRNSFQAKQSVDPAAVQKTGNTQCSVEKLFSSNWFTVKFFNKTLIWRKFCRKTVQSTSQFLGKFLSNQLSSNLFSKNATFTKFLPDESKFRNFPTELYSVENRRAIACNFLLHKNLLREMAYNVFVFVIRSLISRIFFR